MIKLFKKLKVATGCTYEKLALDNHCTKQYINLLLKKPTKKNNAILARTMAIYLQDVIDGEQDEYRRRMSYLQELLREIKLGHDQLTEGETA